MNPALYKPQVFLWSQRDWRWKDKKLGKSNWTVGQAGCAAVSVNYMINRAWMELGIKRFMRPGEFVDLANTMGLFQDDGDLYWNSGDKLSGGHLRHSWDKPKTGRVFTVGAVQWGQLRHFIPFLDGDLCLNPWTGKIEKRNQDIWRPLPYFQYFTLIK